MKKIGAFTYNVFSWNVGIKTSTPYMFVESCEVNVNVKVKLNLVLGVTKQDLH